jgi:hypothetical protein
LLLALDVWVLNADSTDTDFHGMMIFEKMDWADNVIEVLLYVI